MDHETRRDAGGERATEGNEVCDYEGDTTGRRTGGTISHGQRDDKTKGEVKANNSFDNYTI